MKPETYEPGDVSDVIDVEAEIVSGESDSAAPRAETPELNLDLGTALQSWGKVAISLFIIDLLTGGGRPR